MQYEDFGLFGSPRLNMYGRGGAGNIEQHAIAQKRAAEVLLMPSAIVETLSKSSESSSSNAIVF